MVVRAGPSGGGGVGTAAVAATECQRAAQSSAQACLLPSQSQRLFVFARFRKSWMAFKFRAQLSVSQGITPLDLTSVLICNWIVNRVFFPLFFNITGVCRDNS